jgi:hypothetical protein
LARSFSKKYMKYEKLFHCSSKVKFSSISNNLIGVK